MKNNISILILITIFIFSCSEKNKQITIEQKENLIELKKKIYTTGDEAAFTDLILKTGNTQYPYEILPYAIIMANKYNNGEGCHQVLLGMMYINNPNIHGYDLSKIDLFSETDKQFVISYLIKGAKLNNINCILALEEMYRNGWGVSKDIQKADELEKAYQNIPK